MQLHRTCERRRESNVWHGKQVSPSLPEFPNDHDKIHWTISEQLHMCVRECGKLTQQLFIWVNKKLRCNLATLLGTFVNAPQATLNWCSHLLITTLRINYDILHSIYIIIGLAPINSSACAKHTSRHIHLTTFDYSSSILLQHNISVLANVSKWCANAIHA